MYNKFVRKLNKMYKNKQNIDAKYTFSFLQLLFIF